MNVSVIVGVPPELFKEIACPADPAKLVHAPVLLLHDELLRFDSNVGGATVYGCEEIAVVPKSCKYMVVCPHTLPTPAIMAHKSPKRSTFIFIVVVFFVVIRDWLLVKKRAIGLRRRKCGMENQASRRVYRRKGSKGMRARFMGWEELTQR